VSVSGYGWELVQKDQKKVVLFSDNTKIKTDVVGTFACPSNEPSLTTTKNGKGTETDVGNQPPFVAAWGIRSHFEILKIERDRFGNSTQTEVGNQPPVVTQDKKGIM
jgi:hypothetical protein